MRTGLKCACGSIVALYSNNSLVMVEGKASSHGLIKLADVFMMGKRQCLSLSCASLPYQSACTIQALMRVLVAAQTRPRGRTLNATCMHLT